MVVSGPLDNSLSRVYVCVWGGLVIWESAAILGDKVTRSRLFDVVARAVWFGVVAGAGVVLCVVSYVGWPESGYVVGVIVVGMVLGWAAVRVMSVGGR